ncbi:MAG: FMN-binding protein [Planctomycetota bacterium]|nr:MAG: FMN-binding protein [Planctomycetota bacterium]
METAWYNRWLEAFAAKASRPWRLAAFTFLISLLYPGTRFFLLAVIFIVLVVKSVEYGVKNGKWWGLKALIGVFLFSCLVYAAAAAEAYRVARYRRALGDTIPLDLKTGIYEAEADGARGPVHVQVEIIETGLSPTGNLIHRIDSPLELHRETGSIGGNAIKELNYRYRPGTEKIRALNKDLITRRLDQAMDSIDGITGATLTSRAYRKAVKTAIIKAHRTPKKLSTFTHFVYFFLKNEISKISFNTLAIIFILIVFFDYTLQGLLVRGTGQAVSCMNCQTCVGACPVKRVELDGKEYAFPMDMVLAARLGDYELVKKLSWFCVGCAKCSGKCPIGISAPSVASAGVRFLKAREAEKEKADAGGGRHG